MECDHKIFYKGKTFSSREDFINFVRDWPNLRCDESNFLHEWEELGKNLWTSLESLEVLNYEIQEIFEEVFEKLACKFFDKVCQKEIGHLMKVKQDPEIVRP